MTNHIRLSSEAQAELAGATRWFEQRRTGLGEDLLAAISHTLSLIADRPDVGRPVPGIGRADAKRLLLPRFPYQVIYRAHAENISSSLRSLI